MVVTDKEVLFNESRNGLYYNDPEDRDLIIINTVEENRERFSYRELSGDRDARRALAMLSYPSQKRFEHMVFTIKNCPVAIEDVRNANTIYGCNFPTLKGKKYRQQTKHKQT